MYAVDQQSDTFNTESTLFFSQLGYSEPSDSKTTTLIVHTDNSVYIVLVCLLLCTKFICFVKRNRSNHV